MQPMRYKIFLIFLLFKTMGWTQTNNDPLYVNFGYFSKAAIKDVEVKTPLLYMDFGLVLPEWKLSERTKFHLQLNFKHFAYDFEPEISENQNFTDARMGFIVRHHFSEKYELLFLPRLHLRTNFEEEWEKRSLFPSFSAILLHHAPANPDLTYGAGLSLNNDLNRNSILPLGYLSYKSDKLRVNAIVPVYVYITLLSQNKKLEYGLATNFDAQILNFSNEGATYLKTRNILIGPTFSYNPAGKLWINFKCGVSLFRNFEWLDKDFESFMTYESQYFQARQLDPAFFAIGGLSWRLGE